MRNEEAASGCTASLFVERRGGANFCRLLVGCGLLLSAHSFAESSAPGPAQKETRPSELGLYGVSYVADPGTVTINRMHAWTICLYDARGAPVAGASITVEGGMPEHDHGLPTAPRITDYLGAGCYRLDGVRFHMAGVWELVFHMQAAPGMDSYRLAFEI